MKAAWYEKQGPAREVLAIGDMPYPRVIPHSDGAGQVDQVGDGISSEWLGKSVWCYGAHHIARLALPLNLQSSRQRRPFLYPRT
jgi:NADPH:quinone reductase-like Zn-dependent oxidoreductase